MNIILLDKGEIQGRSVFLEGERAEHLIKVLRAKQGDWIRVGQIGGLLGRGQIVFLREKRPFSARLYLELTDSPPALPRLDLVLALPRPIMLRRILSQVTALGVGRIFLINSQRVERSFWQSNLLQAKVYRQYLRKGLEQAAVDTRLPELHIHRKFKPFIEDFFPGQMAYYQHGILADPSGKHSPGEVLKKSGGRIVLAVGPEGGWVDYEVARFEELGFVCCTMGERILKVDTAVIALHAQIFAYADRS